MKSTFIAVTAIAGNTFREAVRNKVLASIAFFALILFGTSVVLGQMSLHFEVRVTTDFGLYLSTIFGVVITIHAMVTLLQTEISRRTIYTLLSKPIARWEFFLGKYLGVAALAAVISTVMYLLTLGLVVAQGGEPTQPLAMAFFTLYLQLAIVAAITAAFSTVSSPLLSGMFSGTVFVCGNLVSQISNVKDFLVGPGDLLGPVVDAVILVLPSFEVLNLTAFAAYEQVLPWAVAAQALAYSVTYIAATLMIGIAIFSRKDFN